MLVVVFAVGAVASSAASAATPEWQINGKAITGSHEVSLQFSKIKIGDLGHIGGGAVLNCEGLAKSTLSATKDEITSFELSNCTFEKYGTCSQSLSPTLGWRGLPWSTELYEEGGKVKDRIKDKEVGKEIGYAWECKTEGRSNFDECTALELNTPMSNVTGGVDAEFATKLTCSQGGKAMGILEGVGLYENPSKTEILTQTGGPAAPEWRQAGTKLSEPVATKWKGMVKLADTKATGGAVAVECEETGEGTAGPGAVGEVTKVTLSKCVLKESGLCKTSEAPTAEVRYLPWHSELDIITGGAVHDVITKIGSKYPGYSFTCENALGGKTTDVCQAESGPLETGMTNTTGGVNATFDGGKLYCSVGGKEAGTLEGTHLIEAIKGGKLEVT